MEESLSIEINATPQRVFDAIVFELTKIERRNCNFNEPRARRRPEGEISRGTVIDLVAEGSPIPMSFSLKFLEYHPADSVKVELAGMGAIINCIYRITESDLKCELHLCSRIDHITTYMKIMNWLNKRFIKKKPSLQPIKELAESDQDLRV